MINKWRKRTKPDIIIINAKKRSMQDIVIGLAEDRFLEMSATSQALLICDNDFVNSLAHELGIDVLVLCSCKIVTPYGELFVTISEDVRAIIVAIPPSLRQEIINDTQ